MNPLPLRVVVVDDHQPWHQQMTSLLERSGSCRVVGEAVDGARACDLAAALKPDLLLIDIELPTLSGIEAATRILAADPAARIIFLTSHRAWGIVEAALSTGARGYVVKSYAGEELHAAVDAVAAGRRYLSAALGGRPASADPNASSRHRHCAGFYTSEESLIAQYERFAADNLNAGKVVISVTGHARRHELLARLRVRDVDIDRAIADDRYIALDTDDLIAPLLREGLPDEAVLWKGALALMMRAGRALRNNPPAAVIFGDGAQRLWDAGRPDAAIHCEHFWNDVSKTLNIDLLCGYLLEGAGQPDDERRELIGAAHSSTHTR